MGQRGRVEELEMMGGNSGGCRGESHRPGQDREKNGEW